MEYYLFAFESTHGAITSKKNLEKEIDLVMMPTLREITSSCGISLRIEPKDLERAKQLMEESGITGYALYMVREKEVKCISECKKE